MIYAAVLLLVFAIELITANKALTARIDNGDDA